jgi:hypothetical protein
VNLIEVCLVAFLTVMSVLSVLALSIRLLTRFAPVPPENKDHGDPVMVAAVQASIQRVIPGARLIRMERRD